ncbi:hypothetical protein DY000_02001864 [Brassica cretica]|uniref:Reverse transcriptase zinc-binding domain-containing protein n=1 Tax=Brassica cretica TaxID=69181 RepID=A0ABQ7C353_BRACR|nr:hypothetical protein DY000_02001864 [Brassica cretica]
MWEDNGDELEEFSTSKTWNVMQNRGVEQAWTRSIWFKGHVPRYAFTSWVVHQDRLPTRSRLLIWVNLFGAWRCKGWDIPFELSTPGHRLRNETQLPAELSNEWWRKQQYTTSGSSETQGFTHKNSALQLFFSRSLTVPSRMLSWAGENSRNFNL